jgi:hypothetical protein
MAMAASVRRRPFWRRLLRCWWTAESACCLFSRPLIYLAAYECPWCGRVTSLRDIEHAERWGLDPSRSVRRAMARLQRQLRQFVDRPNTADTRTEIRRLVEAQLREAAADLWGTIALDVTEPTPGSVRVAPGDMFTALLLAGVPLATATKYRGRLEAALPEGTYRLATDGLTFEPRRPAEVVTIHVDLPA